jgi:predicted Zn-dependent protease
MENRRPNQVIRGYKMLNRLEPNLGEDAAALTVLGNVLLTGKQPVEAEHRFKKALGLRPNFAPYEVNLAGAMLASGDTVGAVQHLERAVKLDPLLLQAVQLLSQAYRTQGQSSKAEELIAHYRDAMGISVIAK